MLWYFFFFFFPGEHFFYRITGPEIHLHLMGTLKRTAVFSLSEKNRLKIALKSYEVRNFSLLYCARIVNVQFYIHGVNHEQIYRTILFCLYKYLIFVANYGSKLKRIVVI